MLNIFNNIISHSCLELKITSKLLVELCNKANFNTKNCIRKMTVSLSSKLIQYHNFLNEKFWPNLEEYHIIITASYNHEKLPNNKKLSFLKIQNTK